MINLELAPALEQKQELRLGLGAMLEVHFERMMDFAEKHKFTITARSRKGNMVILNRTNVVFTTDLE